MDVFTEISAVQSRIAEITGVPAPGSAQPGFSAALAVALKASPAASPGLSTAGTLATPAPVPPGQLEALVQQSGTTWQVDPALLKAVIANESAFDANATSKVGAQGLMQLMPETAASLGVRDPLDPEQNVSGGARYLRGLLDRFGGDVRLAVAAYNAGPGTVEKYGDVPPFAETQNYVNNVLASFDKYRTR